MPQGTNPVDGMRTELLVEFENMSRLEILAFGKFLRFMKDRLN